jgi:hypothetical protein
MFDLKSILAKCSCGDEFDLVKKNDDKLYSGDNTSVYLLCPKCGRLVRLSIAAFAL